MKNFHLGRKIALIAFCVAIILAIIANVEYYEKQNSDTIMSTSTPSK